MSVAEDIDLAAIANAEQLRRALEEGRVSEGEALVVLMHRIAVKTVEEWVGALPKPVQDDFTAYARERVGATETLQIGRGVSLPEAPGALDALRAWVQLHDREYYRASPPDNAVAPGWSWPIPFGTAA
jgi:hypothetical protein